MLINKIEEKKKYCTQPVFFFFFSGEISLSFDTEIGRIL